MAVPKRKTSKAKKRQRKASHKRSYTAVSEDGRDGGFHVPHRVCPETGMYKGRQVLNITADE